MDHERARERQAGQRLGHDRRDLVAERADHVIGRRGRIHERTQDVEYRAHAERLAHGRDVLHRGVVMRREQEGEAEALQARAGLRFVERDRQAECREHVGAAAAARDGAVAVLHYGQTARGREQRAAGAQVQAARTVAARADDVDVGSGCNRGAQAKLAHAAREPANLLGRLAFGA